MFYMQTFFTAWSVDKAHFSVSCVRSLLQLQSLMTVALCCGKGAAHVARLTNTFTSTDDGSMINVTHTLYTLSSREPDLMCRAAQRDKLCHDNTLYKQNIQETYPEVFLETQRQAECMFR